MAKVLQCSQAPVMPRMQEPFDNFNIALADLQLAQQVLVQAHEAEIQRLQDEIARLLGACNDPYRNLTLQDSPSPRVFSPRVESPSRVCEDKALESSHLLDSSLRQARKSSQLEDEATTIDGESTFQPCADFLGRASTAESSLSYSDKVTGRTTAKAELRSTYDSLKSKVNISEHDPFSWAVGRLGQDSKDWRAFVDTRRLPFAWLENLIHSRMFILTVSVMITSNAFFILIDSDYTVKAALRGYDRHKALGSADDENEPSFIGVLDWVFFIAFCCELFTRLIAEELRFFFGAHWKSNLFDLLLAVVTFAEFFLVGFGIDATFARLFRLVRMSRALRIVRVFKAFRELRVLLDSFFQIFFPLVWSALAMAVVISMVSVVLLHAVSSYCQTATHADEENVHRLRSYFHSLPMCALSLFMALTGGESWWFILDPLLGISFTYGLVFVAYVTFMQLGVLNIVTSIFVQNASAFTQMDSDMIELAAAENQKNVMRQLREIFEALDGDKSGAINIAEFERLTENTKVRALFESVLGQEAWKVGRFFKLLDVDGDEMVEREEFVVGCMRLRGGAKNMDQAMLRTALKTMRRELKQVRREVKLMKLAMEHAKGS